MWSPTHIQVTVQRAKNLLTKGRGATNDAFVLIQMEKEKFQTSVKEKSTNPEWNEECDLTFHKKESKVVLTVFHRNILGLDEFLGQVSVPLEQFESYDRPVNKWYALKGKGEKKEGKYRGEIEIRIAFVVRTCDTQSLNDLSFNKKRRRNSIKDIAVSVGHKFQKMPGRSFSFRENFDPRARLERLRAKRHSTMSDQGSNPNPEEYDEDPDDFVDINDDFNHIPMRKAGPLYSSTLSLPQSAMITSSIREVGSLDDVSNVEDQDSTDNSNSPDLHEGVVKRFTRRLSTIGSHETKPPTHGEWTNRISSHMKDFTRSENNLSESPQIESPNTPEKKGKLEAFRNSLRRHTLHLAEPPDLSALKLSGSPKKHRPEFPKASSLKDYTSILPEGIPQELIQEYDKMNHQDLVILAIKQQADIERQRDKLLDLETYLDNLLVRVMETTPRILQTPYKSSNPACFR